jgi:AAHS family 4-hydroxybenzoate transporter-like MFS transporter
LQSTFHVPAFINEKPVGSWQYVVTLLCGLVMFLDGFDTQAISYMAPDIAKEWGLSRAVLGPIFSAALTGLMAGYLVLSPLSDRFGHRRIMLLSTLAFGVVTLITAFASNVTELIGLRFVTGLFLGAAIPSAVALTGEYSPKRFRATFVLAIYCGFSLGFVAVGAIAAWLLPLYGWRSLLWVGAAAPLILSVFLYLLLPESLDFLVRTKADGRDIWRILRHVDPAIPDSAPSSFTTEEKESKGAIASLFSSGRALGTIVLWIVFFLNLAEFYALQSWLPTILTNLNYPLSSVALATTLTTVGGIVIALVIGPAMDRLGPFRSLAVLYFSGVAFVALMGAALSRPEWVLMVATFFAGCCVSGGQKSVIALAAVFYPAPIRSTGVGWALGIGRLGGIGGPLLIGLLLSWHLTPASLFYAASLPMLVAGVLVAILGLRYGRAAVSQERVLMESNAR